MLLPFPIWKSNVGVNSIDWSNKERIIRYSLFQTFSNSFNLTKSSSLPHLLPCYSFSQQICCNSWVLLYILRHLPSFTSLRLPWHWNICLTRIFELYFELLVSTTCEFAHQWMKIIAVGPDKTKYFSGYQLKTMSVFDYLLLAKVILNILYF